MKNVSQNGAHDAPRLPLETQALVERAKQLIRQSGGRLSRSEALTQAALELGVPLEQDWEKEDA